MLLEFLYPLVAFFTPFNVFRYLTFRGAYAALTALLICYLFGPRLIQALQRLKIGQSIRNDGPQSHLKKTGTPTMGGLLIIMAVLVAVILWQDLGNLQVWLTSAAMVGFGIIGFIDDYLKVSRKKSEGLSVKAKFLCQFIVAIGISLTLYALGDERTSYLYLPFIKTPVLDMGWLWIPFAVLLLVWESNAVNLTDGLDGLATGLVIMVFITLSVLTYLSGRVDFSEYLGIPYIKGAGEMTIFCLAMFGACVGFLWFNAHPAEIIMGDVGSLAIGGATATISLIIKKEILILIVGGVFLLEGISVLIQVVWFKLRKQRVFKMAPLHHHFELSGWAETKVVIRFWILGGLFAIVALSTLKIQ